LAVPVAVLDGRNLDICCPDRNSEPDGLQHVNFLCLVNVVLKALQHEIVEATVVIGFKIAADVGFTWLDLGRHIGRKVQDTCVSQLDVGRSCSRGTCALQLLRTKRTLRLAT